MSGTCRVSSRQSKIQVSYLNASIARLSSALNNCKVLFSSLGRVDDGVRRPDDVDRGPSAVDNHACALHRRSQRRGNR